MIILLRKQKTLILVMSSILSNFMRQKTQGCFEYYEMLPRYQLKRPTLRAFTKRDKGSLFSKQMAAS